MGFEQMRLLLETLRGVSDLMKELARKTLAGTPETPTKSSETPTEGFKSGRTPTKLYPNSHRATDSFRRLFFCLYLCPCKPSGENVRTSCRAVVHSGLQRHTLHL
jgi:hypothetical protein